MKYMFFALILLLAPVSLQAQTVQFTSVEALPGTGAVGTSVVISRVGDNTYRGTMVTCWGLCKKHPVVIQFDGNRFVLKSPGGDNTGEIRDKRMYLSHTTDPMYRCAKGQQYVGPGEYAECVNHVDF